MSFYSITGEGDSLESVRNETTVAISLDNGQLHGTSRGLEEPPDDKVARWDDPHVPGGLVDFFSRRFAIATTEGPVPGLIRWSALISHWKLWKPRQHI
jgi:hypothetical protein